jgi:hypothetical protein
VLTRLTRTSRRNNVAVGIHTAYRCRHGVLTALQANILAHDWPGAPWLLSKRGIWLESLDAWVQTVRLSTLYLDISWKAYSGEQLG